MDNVNPKYPVYIISKGRAKSRITARRLNAYGVPYSIVIEPQEYDDYAVVIDPKKILVLPFSNLGQGSVPARNWVWDHATASGAEKHWILDDNIRDFVRFVRSYRVRCDDGNLFRQHEDFVDRFENVKMSGLNYRNFARPCNGASLPPYYLNTKIYSCILLSNDLTMRWRGKYNEDTDLSIRILKDGYCTILNNAFLCDKVTTLTMKGGNTEEIYKYGEGEYDNRYAFAKSLYDQHPDVVNITKKWGRYHHHVDYTKFSGNKLVLKPGLSFSKTPNENGQVLVRIKDSQVA